MDSAIESLKVEIEAIKRILQQHMVTPSSTASQSPLHSPTPLQSSCSEPSPPPNCLTQDTMSQNGSVVSLDQDQDMSEIEDLNYLNYE